MVDKLFSYYYNMGLKRARSNEITLAANSLLTAVALKADDINALNLLGLCYYRLGKLPTAEYCWMKSLYFNNANNPALEYVKSVRDEKKNLEDCVLSIEALIEKREYKKALKVLQKKMQKKQGFIRRFIRKFDIKFIKKNNTEKRDSDKKSNNVIKNMNVMMLNYEGLLYMLCGKHEEALESWGMALSLDLSNPQALAYIRSFLSSRNR